jgi:hypothetical protein
MTDLILKIYQVFEDNKAYFEALGLQPVKHVDVFRGQPLNPEQFEYYEIPALFIGRKITWTKNGRSYIGNPVLEFHMVTDETWDTSNISTSHVEGLKQTMYYELVQYLLDDLESKTTGKLIRIDNEPVDTGVVTYELLRYQCSYQDPMYTVEEFVEVMIEKLRIAGELKEKLNTT